MEPGLDDRGAGNGVYRRGYVRLVRELVWWERNEAGSLILGYTEGGYEVTAEGAWLMMRLGCWGVG